MSAGGALTKTEMEARRSAEAEIRRRYHGRQFDMDPYGPGVVTAIAVWLLLFAISETPWAYVAGWLQAVGGMVAGVAKSSEVSVLNHGMTRQLNDLLGPRPWK